jgi:hypothetical protein
MAGFSFVLTIISCCRNAALYLRAIAGINGGSKRALTRGEDAIELSSNGDRARRSARGFAAAPSSRDCHHICERPKRAKCAHMSRSKICMVGIFAAAMLSGCAVTSSDVVPAGTDAYRLSVTGARYETQADVNYRALLAANDYCDKTNKHMMFRQSTESSAHSWSPKQEDLTFVCMDEKDPAYMRASVEHVPPVIAQQ